MTLPWVQSQGENKSIGVICTAVHMLQRLKQRGIVPDVLTDQTSARSLVGYLPERLTIAEANVLRESDPKQYIDLATPWPSTCA